MAKIKRITYFLTDQPKIEIPEDCLLNKTKKSIIPRKPYSDKAIKKHQQKHYLGLIKDRTPEQIRAINESIKLFESGVWKRDGKYIPLPCKIKYKRK